MILPVPHYQQAHPYSCIPACARMILAYYGQEYSEKALTQAFNTIPFLGTQPDNIVSGLETLGFHALWFENATIERVLEILDANWPLIAFVRAQDLPHGRAGIHAVVIIGMENDTIICLDPTLTETLHVNQSSFMSLWGNLGRQGVAIWK